jgi:anti-sigma factor RsiW
MTTLAQSDLSAEVARLREERDEARAALRGVRNWGPWLDGKDCWCLTSEHGRSLFQPERTADGYRHTAACDAARAALASLGSPQDERNTKKEDAP